MFVVSDFVQKYKKSKGDIRIPAGKLEQEKDSTSDPRCVREGRDDDCVRERIRVLAHRRSQRNDDDDF